MRNGSPGTNHRGLESIFQGLEPITGDSCRGRAVGRDSCVAGPPDVPSSVRLLTSPQQLQS
eukprot:7484120-Pyramimonas_sp.AAC.1